MTEGIHDGALQHASNRVWAFGCVGVFVYRAMLDRSDGQSLPMCGDGVVHKKLDSNGGEAGGRRSARSVLRRFGGKKEAGTVDGEACDDVPTVQVPQELRTECGFVECDRGISVADRQHGRDLSHACHLRC